MKHSSKSLVDQLEESVDNLSTMMRVYVIVICILIIALLSTFGLIVLEANGII